jgi:peptidoglycan/LPS O-acetylase OafA/YrhL
VPLDALTRILRDRATRDPGRQTSADPVTVYRPDLDGLRAIAIGMVILTHARWPWVNNGGDAGVTAFFVLSGYLITNVLVTQRARRGRIDVLAFYRRRIERLAPALLGLLAFVVVYGVTLGWGPREWQLGVLSCLAYVTNWADVAGVSVEPLAHAWSLAIEEQFYLIWPAMLILLRGRLLTVAVVAIVAASAVRLVATGPFEYFSTITRADAILLGCVVALTRPRWPAWIAAAGLLALVAVAFVIPTVHDVAIPVAMLATVAVIGGELKPLGRLAPIGLRAYSLYLWNWPMTILFGSVGAIAPLMTILIGELSFRLLEAPVLHRGRGAARTPALVAVGPGRAAGALASVAVGPGPTATGALVPLTVGPESVADRGPRDR